jgi:hypothetical protein
MPKYTLVFDGVILKQLKKIKDKKVRQILSRMFDRVEERGARAGELLDSQLHLYEMKSKRPPLRLYFKMVERLKEAYVFEYEMKTSSSKQQSTIQKIREKLKS